MVFICALYFIINDDLILIKNFIQQPNEIRF